MTNFSKKESQESYQVLAKNMEVNTLTEEQRRVFINQVQPVYDYYINKGVFSQTDIDAIRRVAAGM